MVFTRQRKGLEVEVRNYRMELPAQLSRPHEDCHKLMQNCIRVELNHLHASLITLDIFILATGGQKPIT